MIWKLACFMITSTLFLFIGTMTCFHDGPLVVILNLGLAMFDLWMILFISSIFLGDRVGNKSLMWMTSSTLIFEACAYDFFISWFC